MLDAASVTVIDINLPRMRRHRLQIVPAKKGGDVDTLGVMHLTKLEARSLGQPGNELVTVAAVNFELAREEF